ncbi:hypothetical protein [Intestinibacillus massiliensis]|uniref:hypothetical protein n=1 Tax=Intestinibacillus massiliensis TaxID=1871029 RepID=UPI000B358F47|nr:hypothetical protein [Intestinibacillus massiliensis]
MGFEFKKRGFPVEVAGHPFTLETGTAAARKLEAFGAEAKRLAGELPKTAEGMETAWGFLAGTLDGLLGDGATDTIFAGREHDLFDLVDVLTYLCDAYKAQAAAATAQWAS